MDKRLLDDSQFISVPIRKILPEEIVEFVEFVIQHGDINYIAGMDQPGGKLTELVCEACLGNFVINVPTEDRGFAALIQLKWGQSG